MTLQELRDYIRTQLDMDEEELPNALLDSYLAEGYWRTISQETRWPFFETRWDVAKIDGNRTLQLPDNCDPVGIMALIDVSSGQRLMQIGSEAADDHFVSMNSAGSPLYFSLEANIVYLYPSSEGGEIQYRLRGHRYGTDWYNQGAGASVDADPRLHQLLAHYAIALCYAQQEDEVLEDVYMKRWAGSYQTIHDAICAPRHHRPLVFNVGLPLGSMGPSVALNLPPS